MNCDITCSTYFQNLFVLTSKGNSTIDDEGIITLAVMLSSVAYLKTRMVEKQ